MPDMQQLLNQIFTSLVGTVRRLRVTVAKSDGTEIEPATEAKQDESKAVLDTIAAKDFATAAKQDAAKTRLDLLATEAKLEAVRALLAGTLTADVSDRANRVLGGVQLTGSKAQNYETITVSDSIKTLTPGANTRAFISCETAPVRFRIDGGNPTVDIGHLLGAGDILILESVDDMANFKAIRRSSIDAVLHCSYSVVA